MKQEALQEKVKGYNTSDIACHSPLGVGAALPSSASATSLLDKLLAQTRAVQQKLDVMTTPPSGGTTSKEAGVSRGPSSPTGQPVATLDRCLVRAQTLLNKADKLSAGVAARWAQTSRHPPADTKTSHTAGFPKPLQVQVCTDESVDASAHSPIGSKATGPLEAGGLVTATQDGEQHTEAAAAGHLEADTMHPKTHQVQVYAVGASDASAYLPLGSVATASLAAESTQSTLYKAAAKSELLEAGPMGDVSHLSEVT